MAKNIFEDLVIRGGLVGSDNRIILFQDIPFTMYPARAFAITLQKLKNDKGIEYIKELGRITGKTAAETFKEKLAKIKNLIKTDYQKLSNLIELSGFGKIDSLIEKKDKLIIRVKDHPVIKFGKELYGEESGICEFYGESYSEFIKAFTNNKKIKTSHPKYISKKNDIYEWEFKK